MEIDFASVVDAMPGLVWTTRRDGRVDFLNRRWREYAGRESSVPVDLEWHTAIHPEDLSRWLERWQTHPAPAEPWECELRLRRADGEYRWFLCRAAPLTEASGATIGCCGINIDIDERRRAETASIAHEVNQPLSGIITNASTCLRMLDSTPANIDGARETARRILRDGNRAADVISRLRALFTKHEFTLGPLDLNEATRDVLALSAGDLRRNDIVLQLELADDLVPVMGDRVQLQQVILNLVRNALDSMRELSDRSRRLVIRTEREDGAYVRLTVRDEGVGLDGHSVDKLFDAFYTTKSAGMGVGLSVSRSIIESHRGRIWATPNEDSGATFAFSIPSAKR